MSIQCFVLCFILKDNNININNNNNNNNNSNNIRVRKPVTLQRVASVEVKVEVRSEIGINKNFSQFLVLAKSKSKNKITRVLLRVNPVANQFRLLAKRPSHLERSKFKFFCNFNFLLDRAKVLAKCSLLGEISIPVQSKYQRTKCTFSVRKYSESGLM